MAPTMIKTPQIEAVSPIINFCVFVKLIDPFDFSSLGGSVWLAVNVVSRRRKLPETAEIKEKSKKSIWKKIPING